MSKRNERDERVFSTDTSDWATYQMHVLSTLNRFEKNIDDLQDMHAKFQDELSEMREKFHNDLTSIREDINNLRSSLNEEVSKMNIQTHVSDLEKRLEDAKKGIERAKEEQKIESHLESSGKWKWLLWGSVIGLGVFGIEMVARVILKVFGVEF